MGEDGEFKVFSPWRVNFLKIRRRISKIFLDSHRFSGYFNLKEIFFHSLFPDSEIFGLSPDSQIFGFSPDSKIFGFSSDSKISGFFPDSKISRFFPDSKISGFSPYPDSKMTSPNPYPKFFPSFPLPKNSPSISLQNFPSKTFSPKINSCPQVSFFFDFSSPPQRGGCSFSWTSPTLKISACGQCLHFVATPTAVAHLPCHQSTWEIQPCLLCFKLFDWSSWEWSSHCRVDPFKLVLLPPLFFFNKSQFISDDLFGAGLRTERLGGVLRGFEKILRF